MKYNAKGDKDPARELYRIYEYDEGLCFPDMKFRCGSLDNYVKTGLLTKEELEEIWKENDLMK
ncbi:MAG: hypothetical protein K6G26_11490 [Lachnospiraceae bacterium]|nr:hypothetical protein [Lachnospiraceae bacterium]